MSLKIFKVSQLRLAQLAVTRSSIRPEEFKSQAAQSFKLLKHKSERERDEPEGHYTVAEFTITIDDFIVPAEVIGWINDRKNPTAFVDTFIQADYDDVAPGKNLSYRQVDRMLTFMSKELSPFFADLVLRNWVN